MPTQTLGRSPITSIYAPTGYGKSALIAEWARSRRAAVAWLSLSGEEADADPATDCFEALRQMDPSIRPQDDDSWAATVSALDRPVTLVVDNMQFCSPAMTAFLQNLITDTPPNLRLIFASRRSLPFDLTIPRMRGRLETLDGHDLAFSPDEARTFLTGIYGSTLPPAEMDDIIDAVDGWPSALNVVAHACVRARRSECRSYLRQVARETLDDIVDAVISRWYPAYREMMTEFAIADVLTPEVLDAIAASWMGGRSGAEVLRLIYRGHLLIVQDAAGDYRLRPIFRDRIMARLSEVDDTIDVPAIHRELARWHSARNAIEPAIRHALAGNDGSFATDIATRACARELSLDRWVDVERWLDLLGDTLGDQSVELLIARAWVLKCRGRWNAIPGVVARARRLLATQFHVEDVQRERYHAELDLAQTFASPRDCRGAAPLAMYQRAFEVLRGTGTFGELVGTRLFLRCLSTTDYDRALAIISELSVEVDGKTDASSQVRALWLEYLTYSIFDSDATVMSLYDQARTILAHATRLQVRRHMATGWMGLAEGALELGQYHEAAMWAGMVIDEPYAMLRHRVAAHLILAVAKEMMDAPGEADRTLDACIDLIHDSQVPEFTTYVHFTEMRLAMRRGDSIRAGRLARAIEPASRRSMARFDSPMMALALWYAQGTGERDADRAEHILADLRGDPGLFPNWRGRVSLLLAESMWHWRRGEIGEAAAHLDEAVRIGERTGLYITFLTLADAYVQMITSLAAHLPPWPYLEEIIEAFRRGSRELTTVSTPECAPVEATVPMPVDGLTDRELDVLQLMALRQSNKEIAATLSISPLTVKTHSRNIYGKLGVTGRRQAVEQASRLGLLR